MTSQQAPTLAFYAALQKAFDYFNDALFDGRLPPCLITLRSSSRVYGYHHADRFISKDGQQLDELGLHPGFFTLRPIEAVMSTLVHEMVHHWQHHFGTPTPTNAHNQEWADQMEAIGLMPSHTSLPGGKKTGRSMSHYILPEGKFMLACQSFVADGFELPWFDRHLPSTPEVQEQKQEALKAAGVEYESSPPPVAVLPRIEEDKPTVYMPPPKAPPTREKLMCPECGAKAWVSPGTDIICGECEVHMDAAANVKLPVDKPLNTF